VECGSERNDGGTCTVSEERAEILVCARDQKLPDVLLRVLKPSLFWIS